MPTLARFELEIHERVERGEALSAQALIDLMADLFAEGYGDEVVMDRERVGITWAQFATHLYANFYVYQYATGISGAHALAEGVLSGKPGAAEKYIEFLKAGGSLFPLMNNHNESNSPQWTSAELERLTEEIAKLNERYLLSMRELRRHPPGSEEYIQRWAELDVLLEWLQKKVAQARQEIARLEETWPRGSG
jgi:oligoendopeptidase F